MWWKPFSIGRTTIGRKDAAFTRDGVVGGKTEGASDEQRSASKHFDIFEQYRKNNRLFFTAKPA
jgi:hypothetical protein